MLTIGMKLTPDGYKSWRLKKEDLKAELGDRILAPIYILGLPGDVKRFEDWFNNLQTEPTTFDNKDSH